MKNAIIFIMFFSVIFYSCENKPDSFQHLNERDKILALLLRQSIISFNLPPPHPPAHETDATYKPEDQHFEPIRAIYLYPQWLKSNQDSNLKEAWLPDSLSEYKALLTEIKNYNKEESIVVDKIRQFFGDSVQITISEKDNGNLKVEMAVSFIAIDAIAENRAMAYVTQTVSGLDGGSGLVLFKKNKTGAWEVIERVETATF